MGNIVDIEVWRVQVKLSSERHFGIFLLCLQPTSTLWLLGSIAVIEG
ncbi:hypothetical protein [Arthrobacter sp. StoSoilA2]|nr:hypothetical protein [Arthrobacter sp. StoSoilA2]